MQTGRRWTRSGSRYAVISLVALFFCGVVLYASQPDPAAKRSFKQASTEKPVAQPKHTQINFDKAVAINLPEAAQELKPAAFKTADGREGWMVRIPGGRPIATPAYSGGKIFVGGGYGSHEFYAFDAATGAMLWKTQTSDDGPTAAVVEDGLVAFNTESCTVIVVDEQTGKVVWQEWLGDPLMSQPAISKGRLFIAFPAGQRGHQNHFPKQGIHANQTAQALQHAKSARTGGHRLLCADLKTGRHIWEQVIPSDVISAPVVSGEQIFFTCFDGTSFCLDASDGHVVWEKKHAGTSAPIVAAGQVLLTQKETSGGKDYEGVQRLDARRGVARDDKLLAREEAQYLNEGKGGGVALSQQAQQSLDSSVGFSNAPAAASLGTASKNVGVTTVAGGWAYQGSRAAYSKGQMLNAQGRYLNSITAADGRFNWRAEVKGAGIEEDAQVFSPPALGEQYMYLSSSFGHLLSVRQRDGEVGFLYSLKQPMTFQPALARGNIYVGTVNGLLICLKTGGNDADGWYAWGGNAQHNKN